MVLDAAGEPVSARVKRRTPYPCPPAILVSAVSELAAQTGVDYDRVSVGFPGMVRSGVVYATPHYVTEAGPFTPVRPDLVKEWQEFDVRAALEAELGRPTRVRNDAEIAGLAVPVARLAAGGDAVAVRIMGKVAGDLTALALHAARRLFQPGEAFPLAAAGGLFGAGQMLLKPLQDGLAREFPRANLVLGTAEPAVALGRLAIDDLIHNRRNYAD